MLENQILQLLKKISQQLEDISSVQHEIKSEIAALYRHLLVLEESTLKNLEARWPKSRIDSFLN